MPRTQDSPPTASPRIAALDFIRGVAVMGILVANMPAFALPEAAYFSPLAWGGSTGADRAAWAINFVAVEGKMRGLFSFLFGASLLLVVDRARAAGHDPVAVHYSRMFWLFAFGCAHLYLFWWGDILAHYALVGAVAFMFAGLPVRWLLAVGAMLLAWQCSIAIGMALDAFASHARDTPAAIARWSDLARGFGVPPPSRLAAEIAANRGGFLQSVAWRWEHAISPIDFLLFGGAETLAFMLFGMAGLRSGFLTGTWPRARYVRWAATAIGIALPVYVALAAATIAHGFDIRYVVLGAVAAPVPIRPILVAGYAALAVLAMRPGGWLTDRVAAAGRMAFSNYLGTTLVMTALFQGWGLGLFATLGRAQLYLLVPVAWALMLAWSRPWLARYRHGPLEWLWRSLARWERQPIRV